MKYSHWVKFVLPMVGFLFVFGGARRHHPGYGWRLTYGIYPYRPRQLNHARRVAIRPRHGRLAALSPAAFLSEGDRGRVPRQFVLGSVCLQLLTIVISPVTIPLLPLPAPRKRHSANSSAVQFDAFNHENCVAESSVIIAPIEASTYGSFFVVVKLDRGKERYSSSIPGGKSVDVFSANGQGVLLDGGIHQHVAGFRWSCFDDDGMTSFSEMCVPLFVCG